MLLSVNAYTNQDLYDQGQNVYQQKSIPNEVKGFTNQSLYWSVYTSQDLYWTKSIPVKVYSGRGLYLSVYTSKDLYRSRFTLVKVCTAQCLYTSQSVYQSNSKLVGVYIG